jgi:3-oxoacyl-[acyl-carrier protein] reductase
MTKRPIALITGASRKIGIGSSIVISLAKSGWDIGFTYWLDYDKSMPWGSQSEEIEETQKIAEEHGAKVFSIEADLSDTKSPGSDF